MKNKKANMVLALTFTLAFLLLTLGILLTHTHSSPTGYATAGAPAGSDIINATVQEVWNRTQDPYGSYDHAYAAAVDSQDNIITSGYIGPSISTLIYYTAKHDENGTSLWNRSVVGGGNTNVAYDVAVDSQDNVLVAGLYEGIWSDLQWIIMKYNENGTAINNVNLSRLPVGTYNYYAHSITVDSQDNVIVTGYEEIISTPGLFDQWITIKYDENLTQLYQANFSAQSFGCSDSRAYGTAIDSQDNIFVSGTYKCGTLQKWLFIKYDSNLVHRWNISFTVASQNLPSPKIAVDQRDDSFVITGGGTIAGVTSGNGYDFITVKYNSNGNELWNRTYDGGYASVTGDAAYDVAVDSLGNIIVTGFSTNSSGFTNIFTIAYDEDGNHLWNISRSEGFASRGHGVAFDSSNNVAVAGSVYVIGSNPDFAVIKYSTDYLFPPVVLPDNCSGFIGNESNLNCTIVQGNCSDNPLTTNFTRILGLFSCNNSHVELANQTGFNYSLCCDATGAVLGTEDTNDSYSFNFLNLFQINNSHTELSNNTIMSYFNGTNTTINQASPYNVSAFISVSNGQVSCTAYENLYGNCTYENETCLLTLPINATANTTNLHVSSCNSTHAYDTSLCCSLSPGELRIFIDGNETTNISKTALPYLLSALSLPNSKVAIFEEQGNTVFIPLRLSGTITKSMAIGETDSNGNITFVLAPTDYPSITNYSLIVARVDDDYNILEQVNLTIIDSTAIPQEKKPFTGVIDTDTKQSVNSINAIVSSLFIWANSPPQANMFNITVYTNGSYVFSSTATNDEVQTGAVNVINVTLINSTDLAVISGLVEPKETEGHLLVNPIYQSTATGNKTHISFSRYIPTQQEFIITPTDYPPASSQAQIIVYYTNLTEAATVNLSINSLLEPRSGVSYENDDLKQGINAINPVIQNLFYALN